GKGRQWEGGIREPYYIYVPGMTKAKSTTDIPAIHMDFYPTILELAGLPLMPKQHLDGVSLVPVLKGKKIKERNLFWHYPHYGNQGGEPSSIIRSGNWKLIHYYEDGRDELYNIAKDIGEQTDLAAKHPEKATELRKQLDQWLAETGARIPQPDDRFDAALKEKQLADTRTKKLKKLEADHAKLVEPGYQPNKDWWSSLQPKD
ncbi:MAG: DUF4976 domain-containing protein, partial [Kiritimatiellales bacterium]|nr:DUF4976 domain-containing protein [Kiritimatiellales bacterium]